MTDSGPWASDPARTPPPPPPPPGPMGMPPPPSLGPPPGYVGYGTPGSYSPFSKIRGLAKALVAVQITGAVLTAITLVFQISIAGSASDALDGVTSLEAFEDDMGPILLVLLVGGLAGIASVVLLIIWSYRIAGNLQRAGRQQITWKPGLTIVVWILGGCTLNIINFLMLREHWKASESTSPSISNGWQQSSTNPLIPVWFGLGIAQIILGVMSGIQSFGGIGVGNDTESVAESLADRLPIVLASGVLSIASVAILVLIVRQMTERHTQLTQEA